MADASPDDLRRAFGVASGALVRSDRPGPWIRQVLSGLAERGWTIPDDRLRSLVDALADHRRAKQGPFPGLRELLRYRALTPHQLKYIATAFRERATFLQVVASHPQAGPTVWHRLAHLTDSARVLRRLAAGAAADVGRVRRALIGRADYDTLRALVRAEAATPAEVAEGLRRMGSLQPDALAGDLPGLVRRSHWPASALHPLLESPCADVRQAAILALGSVRPD